MADATIYDVAREAQVSIATVSRVLNAPNQVHVATRERVLGAIDALGFVPKAEASARARSGTRRIGVLAPFFTYPSFVQRLRGVSSALADSGYELVIFNIDSSGQRDSALATLPITRRLDGLIVMALPFGDAAAERLAQRGLETVLIECAHPRFSSIEIDDEAGGRMVAAYLLDKGYRRLGFVGDADVPDYAIHTSARRLVGYQRELERCAGGLPRHYVALAAHTLELARQQAHTLLARPEPPDAIFASSDTQAMGVLKAARERGVAVPAQLAVIGFDDVDIADYIGLTTVRQQLDESGQLAVHMLRARFADKATPVQRVLLPLTIVRRETA